MRRAAGVGLIVLWAGLAPAAAKEKPFPLSTSLDEASRTFVRASGLTALPGIHKAALASFQLEFVVETRAQDLVPSRANEMARLSGVAPEAFVRITDRFHGELVAALKGLGIEVMPDDDIREAKAWGEFRPALRPAPTTLSAPDHTSLFHASEDMPLYFMNTDRRAGRFPRILPTYEVSLAKELGVPLARSRMVIDITAFTGGGKDKGAVTIRGGASSLIFVLPGGRSVEVILAKNVNAAAATFEVPRVDPSFWSSSPSSFYSANPAPARAIRAATDVYEKAVNDHLDAVLSMFVARMKRKP